jgi:hypothetical protein
MNEQAAKSCSFCGYLFEDYGTGTVGSPVVKSSNTSPSNTDGYNPASQPLDQNASASSFPAVTSGGSPYFVVSKSIASSLLPALVYLVFIGSIGLYSGFSIYSLLLVVFFMVVAVVPSLFSPRRFEFYDDSMKIHKTIGGDSQVPYSDLSLVDYPVRGRSPQIVLSVPGQRRPVVIPKNPTNQQLGIDLKQFLTNKLKKTPTGQNSSGDVNSNQQSPPDDNSGGIS